jgi:hypothetical protein
MKLTQKKAQALFAVVMVGTMTFIMTGMTTFVNTGFTLAPAQWMRSWLVAYAVALPIMMLLSPPLRRLIWRFVPAAE